MIVNATTSWFVYIDNLPPLDSLETQDIFSEEK